MAIRKIMLVDDDAGICAVAKITLEDLGGWQVVVASSGEEALGCFAKEAPDLVLLDMMMPDLDGMQVLARLRESGYGHIPIIFLTGKAQPQDLERFRAAGAADVIRKPFDPLILPVQVKQAAKRFELRRGRSVSPPG